MNILNEINNILLSALNVQQKKLVDKIMKHNKNELKSSYDEIFGVGNNRIYLYETIKVSRDLIIDKHIIKNIDTEGKYVEEIKNGIQLFFKYLNKEINEIFLNLRQFYEGKINIDNREYNIGKLLNQIKKNREKLLEYGEELIRNRVPISSFRVGLSINMISNIDNIIKVFNSRFNINSVKDMKLKIVISRDPYDIAGMSTDRRWTSCMNLPNKNRDRAGIYRHFLFGDLTEGTLIAYLVDKDDNDINDPYARVLIKPFINKDKEILLSTEEKVYYDSSYIDINYSIDFMSIVDEWVNDQQDYLEGVFYAHPNLYHDSKKFIDRKKVTEEPQLIENIIYDNIDWDKTLPDNGIKIIRNVVASRYMYIVNDFIDSFNSFISNIIPQFDSVYSGKINLSHMTVDDYKYLNFKINTSESNVITVNIDEIDKEIIRLQSVLPSDYNYEISVLLLSIDEIKKAYNDHDREISESYDLIIVRLSEENENNNKMKDFYNHYEENDENHIYHKQQARLKPLFYAYLVNCGDTNYKENALLRIDIRLGIDSSHIMQLGNNTIHMMFYNDNFIRAFDDNILNYHIDNIFIDSNFIKYLEDAEHKHNNLINRRDLMYSIYDTIGAFLIIYCYGTKIIYDMSRLNETNIEYDDDLEYYYSEFGIHNARDTNKRKYYELEEEIFKDIEDN